MSLPRLGPSIQTEQELGNDLPIFAQNGIWAHMAGDPSVQARLLEVCRRKLGSRLAHRADDAVQTTWLKACEISPENIQKIDSPKSYLVRIAENTCCNIIKAELVALTSTDEQDESVFADGGTAAEHMMNASYKSSRSFQRALKELKLRLREAKNGWRFVVVFNLLLEGRSQCSIAQLLEISPATVSRDINEIIEQIKSFKDALSIDAQDILFLLQALNNGGDDPDPGGGQRSSARRSDKRRQPSSSRTRSKSGTRRLKAGLEELVRVLVNLPAFMNSGGMDAPEYASPASIVSPRDVSTDIRLGFDELALKLATLPAFIEGSCDVNDHYDRHGGGTLSHSARTGELREATVSVRYVMHRAKARARTWLSLKVRKAIRPIKKRRDLLLDGADPSKVQFEPFGNLHSERTRAPCAGMSTQLDMLEALDLRNILLHRIVRSKVQFEPFGNIHAERTRAPCVDMGAHLNMLEALDFRNILLRCVVLSKVQFEPFGNLHVERTQVVCEGMNAHLNMLEVLDRRNLLLRCVVLSKVQFEPIGNLLAERTQAVCAGMGAHLNMLEALDFRNILLRCVVLSKVQSEPFVNIHAERTRALYEDMSAQSDTSEVLNLVINLRRSPFLERAEWRSAAPFAQLLAEISRRTGLKVQQVPL